MKANALLKLVADLNDRTDTGIERFTREFKENPAYAIEWRGATELAATKDVCAYIQGWFENAEKNGATDMDNVAAGIIQYAVQETFRLASQTNQSTSPESNELARHKLAVWASIANKAFEKARYSGEQVTVVFKAVPSATAGKE